MQTGGVYEDGGHPSQGSSNLVKGVPQSLKKKLISEENKRKSSELPPVSCMSTAPMRLSFLLQHRSFCSRHPKRLALNNQRPPSCFRTRTALDETIFSPILDSGFLKYILEIKC